MQYFHEVVTSTISSPERQGGTRCSLTTGMLGHAETAEGRATLMTMEATPFVGFEPDSLCGGVDGKTSVPCTYKVGSEW